MTDHLPLVRDGGRRCVAPGCGLLEEEHSTPEELDLRQRLESLATSWERAADTLDAQGPGISIAVARTCARQLRAALRVGLYPPSAPADAPLDDHGRTPDEAAGIV